ncbi:MAG: DUF2127 domain-containing protein [Steroidobacteraceae bacterium]
MPSGASKRFDGLRLIGLLKIGKALLLLATTYGLYRLLNPDLVEQLHDWISTLTDSFEQRLLERGLDWFDSLGKARIGGILLVTAIYTAVLLTEGIGLWLRKPWAEWVTVIATGSLIPFELYQLFFGHHHRTWAVLGATALNIVIVIYLVYRLRTGRHARQRSA